MKKIYQGYFTVEAALVLPFALGILVFSIYMMFYQYNRCLSDQDLGMIALRGALEKTQDKEELVEKIQQQIGKLYQDKYIAFEGNKVQILLEGNKVKVNGGGKTQVPFPQLSVLTGQDNWEIHRIYTNHRIDPVLFIRTCKRLKNS